MRVESSAATESEFWQPQQMQRAVRLLPADADWLMREVSAPRFIFGDFRRMPTANAEG